MDNKTDFEHMDYEQILELIKENDAFSGSDFWWAIVLLLLIFGFNPPNESESAFWRGKYEALKEQKKQDE